MADTDLVTRLSELPQLAGIAREELEWLADQGQVEVHVVGKVVSPRGKKIEKVWVMLSGRMAIHVDRGAGPRRVMEWHAGDVTGTLPYSRMKGPPGDVVVEETSEVLTLHETYFPELIQKCPTFTAHTVHLMLDRARSFNASDLQDEKMMSLGKLAAGLAHELNNPASVVVRGAKLLRSGLATSDEASRKLGAAGLGADVLDTIDGIHTACRDKTVGSVLSPTEQLSREDEIEAWLARQHLEESDVEQLAEQLSESAITIAALDTLAEATSGSSLEAALRWVAAGCETHTLAVDVERAATRIYELVATVKKFTYMDELSAPEAVDVEAGIQNTVRMVASKAKAKGASIVVQVEPDLPLVHANGGELNQVWLNLIDNALDAIPEGGRVEVSVRRELKRVVVYVTDDGPGIAPDVLPHIFDPFFTTKTPGQGTGLGLEITQRLLRCYQGDISVDSRAGHTEFRVGLLVGDPDPAGKEGGGN